MEDVGWMTDRIIGQSTVSIPGRRFDVDSAGDRTVVFLCETSGVEGT